MKHLIEAMKSGGAVAAVDVCSTKAQRLTAEVVRSLPRAPKSIAADPDDRTTTGSSLLSPSARCGITEGVSLFRQMFYLKQK